MTDFLALNVCCSFCGKSHREVQRIIFASSNAYGAVAICDACVELCNETLAETAIKVKPAKRKR